jgi:hypothetical protein
MFLGRRGGEPHVLFTSLVPSASILSSEKSGEILMFA